MAHGKLYFVDKHSQSSVNSRLTDVPLTQPKQLDPAVLLPNHLIAATDFAALPQNRITTRSNFSNAHLHACETAMHNLLDWLTVIFVSELGRHYRANYCNFHC